MVYESVADESTQNKTSSLDAKLTFLNIAPLLFNNMFASFLLSSLRSDALNLLKRACLDYSPSRGNRKWISAASPCTFRRIGDPTRRTPAPANKAEALHCALESLVGAGAEQEERLT